MSIRKPKFTTEELLSPHTHFRARKEPTQDTYSKWESMMAALVEDVEAGKELSHLETQFFAFCAKNAAPFHSYWNHDVCKNERFEDDIFIYTEKAFNGHYRQPRGGAIVDLTQNEIDELHGRLDEYAKEWKKVIDNKRHKNQFLQQLSTESTQELAKLRKLHRLNKITTEQYEAEKKFVYWRSRTIFLFGGKLLEQYPLSDYQPVINGIKIKFTEYTIIHIMNRHYMGIFQYAYSDKTMMGKSIDFRKLHIILFEIITQIDQSGFYVGQNIGKIPFQFKGDDYIIWTASESHSSKENKNHTIQRLNSFHKIDIPGEVVKLKTDYNLKKINDDLSIYIQTIPAT